MNLFCPSLFLIVSSFDAMFSLLLLILVFVLRSLALCVCASVRLDPLNVRISLVSRLRARMCLSLSGLGVSRSTRGLLVFRFLAATAAWCSSRR